MDLSPEKLRKRFADLTEKYEAGDKKRTALQHERDGKVDSLTEPQRRVYAGKIRKLHAELAPIEEERALISRALGGKTTE